MALGRLSLLVTGTGFWALYAGIQHTLQVCVSRCSPHIAEGSSGSGRLSLANPVCFQIQHWSLPGAGWKGAILGPTPDLLSLNLPFNKIPSSCGCT